MFGALPDLSNVMGVTPLMAAAGVGATRGPVVGQGPIAGSDPESNAVAVIGLLLKSGADVNATITDNLPANTTFVSQVGANAFAGKCRLKPNVWLKPGARVNACTIASHNRHNLSLAPARKDSFCAQ